MINPSRDAFCSSLNLIDAVRYEYQQRIRDIGEIAILG